MAKQILPDGLWSIIQPLLPERPVQDRGGGRWLDDRTVLTGILFVLRTGMAWQDLACRDGLRERDDVLASAA